MRALIWVSIIVGVGIFFWQNPQPIMLSFLGGSVKMQLPLAAWVFIFTVAGAFSSVVVLGMNSASSRRSPQPPPPQTTASRPSSSPQPPFSPDISSREVNASSSGFSSDWQSALPAEEQETWDDWETEAPVAPSPASAQETIRAQETASAQETTSAQDKGVKPPVQENILKPDYDPPPPLRNFEVSQEPEDISREGSVYSYRYRKAEASSEEHPSDTQSTTETPTSQPTNRESDPPPKVKRPRRRQSDEVYDANYRVILPPYRSPAESTEDEEEDWV